MTIWIASFIRCAVQIQANVRGYLERERCPLLVGKQAFEYVLPVDCPWIARGLPVVCPWASKFSSAFGGSTSAHYDATSG